ncbi:glycosyltransferase family 2 protein [Parvularcula flava]|uniref:Glycosyltransferase family 2 protein n=1 Tax=Aquisalinus luteolus TaxID=1566827 RepID=A0A8J3ES86_9PROT|nr:glycosyltransferase family 2 protein [Aquisalinus luteolus]NHK29478.1 glycosyltransferase family 2 protein [Aquisalinus luteolus]GGI01823.1 succinoglycan biosynthesis protein exoa [Aquisalinus luteolus]
MDGSAILTDEKPRAALARRIVVAVPVLNEARAIEACLRSLLEGEDALANVALVVADGGSTDGTQEIVKRLAEEFPNISLIDNPGRLQSAGVNAVARTAGEGRDILVRCDAHADYPQGYVITVAEAMEKRGSDSLVVPMDAVGQGCFQAANAWIVDTPLGSGGSAHRGGTQSGYVDHGHHAAMRLDRFLSLGGYDESFSHNEDAEFDARLRKSGGTIWLDATIRIRYFPRDTIVGLWRQYSGYGRGRARNVLKNRERPRLRQMIPVLNIILLALSVLILPFTWLGLVWPSAYLTLLTGTSLVMPVLKKSLCGLWCGPVLGVMHTAWGLGFLRQVFHAYRNGDL